MITTEGKKQFKRYLAGYVPFIVGSAAYGIGSKSETVLDSTLQFESGRSDIKLVTFDFSTNKLIFKASMPDIIAGKVYEIGLYSSVTAANSTAYGSRIVTSFNANGENWRNAADDTPSSYASTNARIGGDALLHSPLANATALSYLRNINFDFSQNNASDLFSFAYAVVNTNATYIGFNFYTDANNFYTFGFGGADVNSIGYKILTRTKSSANVTGAPDWSKITEIRVATAAGSNQADIEYDGIRIDSPNTYGLDNILVARKVLATPVTKVLGQPQDLEFSLDINL